MTKAAIFDVDGTLIDSVDLHTRAWVEAFHHFGVEASYEDVRPQIGKGDDQLLPVFLPGEVDGRGKAIADFRGELFDREYLAQARPFPGVRALFERIRSGGGRIVLGSSGKAKDLPHYRALAGIDDLVDEMVTGDDVAHSKPLPDIFQAALKRLEPLPASEAVVIGDTPWDALAAGRAGLRCIGLLCGGVDEARLREAGCVEVYRDPEDLLARYDESLLPGAKAAAEGRA